MEGQLSRRALRALSCGHWFLETHDGYISNGTALFTYSLVVHFPNRVWSLPFGVMIIPRRTWHMLEKDLETDNYTTALVLARQNLAEVFGDPEFEVMEYLQEAH